MRSEEEVKYQADEIQRAKDKIAANEEERRQAAKLAASKKKKGGAGGKKEQKEEEEEKKEEKAPAPVKKELDLFIPNEFAQTLKDKIPRPFIFGPIEFTGLNLSEEEEPFRHDLARREVQDNLERTPYLPEHICIHGFKVTIKQKTLKRRSTIVKHSRFLRNLEIYPVFPPEPEPVVPVEEQPNENEEEEDE